jgi:hypothetical protein
VQIPTEDGSSPRTRRANSPGAAVAVGAALGFAAFVGIDAASASHDTVTPDDASYLTLPVSNGESWNGKIVYLGSPRHTASGDPGRECGWEENINGRHFNTYAAIGNYYFGTSSPTSPYRNLNSRGYKVVVSANERDGDWLANRTNGNNLGADIYIVTHTNAPPVGGCGAGGNYVLTMYDHNANQNSIGLANELLTWLDPFVPGTGQNWSQGLSEIGDNNQAAYRSYVELFFHTNQAHVDWFEGGGVPGNGIKYATAYGYAADIELNYP